MRTKDEIAALYEAARFRVVASNASIESESGSTEVDECPMVIVEKGDPPVFVCAEPAMTLHLSTPDGVERIPFAVCPPLCRMAMAYHLGLTSDESATVGLTHEAAQSELRAEIAAYLREQGVDVDEDGISDIPPTDPRWGRP